MNSVEYRGYLHEEWRLFHSADRRNMDFDVHAHAFHKLVVCLSGHVEYTIEGTVYRLSAGDVLMIPAGQLHRSVMSEKDRYERFVLWLRPSAVDSLGEDSVRQIFIGGGVLRLQGEPWDILLHRLTQVEKWWYSDIDGHQLLSWTYLVQALFIVRDMSRNQTETGRTNPRLAEIIRYISDHPSEDLSVEALCSRFFISPSGLMHSFKKYTGCSVHAYIQKKRLHCAATMIRNGEKAISAAESNGFSDYSAFLKAFRKEYGVSPQQVRNEGNTLK